MNIIERIIKENHIDEKRAGLEDNKKQMLIINSLMSKLAFNLPVAKYAYLLDYDNYYSNKSILTNEEQRKYFEGSIQMSILKDDPNVQKYIELLNEYQRLEEECCDYFRTINIDFREDLSGIVDIPNIFVFQGYIGNNNIKLNRHIILSGYYEASSNSPNTIIYPAKDIKSKRDLRHFYNKTSFRYLEELSKDCSFDPKIKKLGKVKII